MTPSSTHHLHSKKHKRCFHFYYLKGVLPFLAIVLNLAFWICPLMILALIKIMIPFATVQKAIYRMMAGIYYIAAWFDGILLFRIMGIQLHVTGMEQTYPGKFYLIIANHQSWSDILIMQHLFNFKAPLVKFLAKRELMMLPIVGWICWAYDFPFLQRRTFKHTKHQTRRSDTQLLTIAIDKFKQSSASIMNFVEGTRFSAAKASRQNAPYEYLLNPKASGLTTIFQTLGNELDSIIDITIVYDSPNPDFWDFLCSRCKKVRITARTVQLKKAFGPDYVPSNPPDFDTVSKWINTVWKQKDNKIKTIRKSLPFQKSL